MTKQALIDLRDAVGSGELPEPYTFKAAFEYAIPEMSDVWQDARDAWGGSLDAAKRLHEAALPGWCWDLEDHGDASISVGTVRGPRFDGYALDNPARAWLLAILEALIQEGGSDD